MAIGNGWVLRDEDKLWHIACLAVGDEWVIGVLARCPGPLGLDYGGRLCQEVGERMLTDR